MLLNEEKQTSLRRASKEYKQKLAMGIFKGYDLGYFDTNTQVIVDKLMGKGAEPNKENYPFFANVFYYLEAQKVLMTHTKIEISNDDRERIKDMGSSTTEIRNFVRDKYHVHVAVERREFNTIVISEVDASLY